MLCAYEVDADPVFDALDEGRRTAMGVNDLELSCPAWEAEMLEGAVPSSQALADRLIAEGYMGMRVRSFAVGSGAGRYQSGALALEFRWAEPCHPDDEGRL